MEKKTIREYGMVPGFLPPGPRNAITDVPGVKVGHWTLRNERHNTGVTVILPRKDIYRHKCTAAAHVINGYGKSAGLPQIMELGELESPIALTNTLNVGLVSDALVELTKRAEEAEGRQLRSFNPVVGECNDGTLNLISERVAGLEQVEAAIADADEEFEQGCVGAGTGMSCHGLKGGIGSASRQISADGKTYTVGVLNLCNHGELKELTLCGRKAGPVFQDLLKKRSAQAAGEDKGSCMIILATDLPLSSRQLTRVIRRCGVGLARCGSFWGHGSGDFAIGFSTARDIPRESSADIMTQQVLCEERMNMVFAAAAEAAEEAVLNALAAAVTTVGYDGTVRYALRDLMPELQ